MGFTGYGLGTVRVGGCEIGWEFTVIFILRSVRRTKKYLFPTRTHDLKILEVLCFEKRITFASVNQCFQLPPSVGAKAQSEAGIFAFMGICL